MRPQQRKQLQLALVVVAVVVGVAVMQTLHGPAPGRPDALPTLPPGAGQPGATQTREGELIELKGGDERVKVRFRRLVGAQTEEQLLEGVEVTFQYSAQGQPGTARLSADECRYQSTLQKAAFRGNVVLTTADGFELRGPTLNYRGDRGVLRSDDPVAFKRKSVSGTAHGFVYHASEGNVEFPAEPYLRIEDDQAPPTEVRGGRAELDKAKGELRFFDGVEATRGEDRLTAQRLVMAFAADRRAINSVQAFEDVLLKMTPGTGAAFGMAGGTKGSGRREIRAPGLGVWFRPDRTPQEASAFFDAELLLFPGPREPQERRSVRAKLLVFQFDRQGHLSEVQGQKDATLSSEPLPPAKGEKQTLTCKNVVARFRPGSGELEEADARGDVEFEQGLRHASAERGHYEGASGRLVLARGQPVLEEKGRSRVTAERIELMTGSGDMLAKGQARQALLAGTRSSGFMAQEGQPTLLSAETISHDARKRLTTYDENALLRTGRDEVRAKRLRILEDASGRRRLEAEEQVFSLLHPAPRPGGEPPAAVEARAASMVYEEARGEVVYTGDVTLKQGTITTASPTAHLKLGPDGRSLQSLVAGEPVELREGQRKANGQRATYTPADETIVVVGEAVSLVGPGQDVRGKSLTFHVGDDRIVVDGREEGRTQTIFRKEPSKP